MIRSRLSVTLILFSIACLSGPVIGAFDVSSINITSDRAQCVRDKTDKHLYTLTYHDNVHIVFSDGTKANTDTLAVVIDPTASGRSAQVGRKNDKLESIKQITLQGNVEVISEQRTASAAKASFALEKQLCVLEGSVHILQKKQTDKDIPITIDCEKAELNLATEQVKLLGSPQKPVSTTLVLDNSNHKKSFLPGSKRHGKNKTSSSRRSA